MSSHELGEVTKLISQLQIAEQKAEELAEQLKTAVDRVRNLKEELLPAAMLELGYKDVTLADGTKVIVKDEVYCSLSEDRKPAGLKWLEDHGFGGLIKGETKIAFGKGDNETIKLAEKFLTELKMDFRTDRTVHPMTFKAFVKEQLEEGNKELPFDLFGVRQVQVAKVEKKKFKL